MNIKLRTSHNTCPIGNIPVAQLVNMLKNIGNKLMDDEIATLLRETNLDINGQVNYDDYHVIMCVTPVA